MLEQFPEGVSARFPVVLTYKYTCDRAVISFLCRSDVQVHVRQSGHLISPCLHTWKQSQRHCTGWSEPSTLGNSPSATVRDGRDLQHLETVPAPLFGTVGTFNTWKQSQRHCTGRSGPSTLGNSPSATVRDGRDLQWHPSGAAVPLQQASFQQVSQNTQLLLTGVL